MTRLEEKTYLKDNVKMVYYEAGEGESLLFIHGAGIRALTYKKSLIKLSENFHVYAPDIPGFGLSDMPPSTWNFTHYATFLNSFLEEQNITNCIIIGHSLGGRIALELATHKKVATRLILIDSSPKAEFYVQNKRSLSSLIFNTSLEIFLERNPNYAKIVVDNLFNLKQHKLSYLKLKKTIDLAFKKETNSLHKIDIPTLILWGDKDRVIKPKIAYAFQKEIKESKVKIINGNHAWCITKPEVLLEEVSSFANS